MSDKTLKDLTVDAHIAVLHTKVDALIEKQKELTERVRANEKVVAALGVLGTIAIAFIGAGAFAPRAEACSQPLDVDGSPANCGPGDRIIYHEDKEPNYDYYSTRDEIIWNASGNASGLYFIEINFNDINSTDYKRDTRKVLYLK